MAIVDLKQQPKIITKQEVCRLDNNGEMEPGEQLTYFRKDH